jgi:hypothetical protein
VYRIVIKAWVSVALLLQAAGAQETPPTVRVLSLAPDSATFALAMPAPGRLERQAMRLAGRLLGDDAALGSARDYYLGALTEALALPPEDSFARTWASMGLDPDAPAGVFVDLSPLRAMAEGAVAIAEGPAPWWHKRKDGEQLGAIARVAVVAGCDSPEQFRAWAEACAEASGLGAPRIENEVHLYDGFAFAIVSGVAIAGNDGGLVGEVVARMGQPAPVRYGTAECPALHPDETVLLTRMDHVWNLVPPVAPMLLTHGAERRETARLLGQALDRPAALFTSSDPCVTTLHLGAEEISFSARLDLTQHVGYAAYSGICAPPSLVRQLPAQVRAFAFFGTLDPLKGYPLEAALAAISFPSDATAQAAALLRSIHGLALGFMLDSSGAPQIVGVLNTTSPGMAAVLIEEGVVKGTGGALQAKQLNDIVAISTHAELLDSIPLVMNDTPVTTNLECLQLPVAQSTPAAGLIVVSAAAIKSGLPLVEKVLSPAFFDALTGLAAIMKEFNAGKVLEGSWQSTFARLSLNPPATP